MPLVSVANLFENWKLKLLFYGPSGTGKTYLAGTSVLVKELCPILWVATERGMLSVREHLETGRVQVLLAQTASDLVALQNVIANPGSFKTIVIDSLSELHALIMQTAQKPGETTPTRNAYREGHDKILKLLRYVDMHSSVHVIATASELPLTDGESGRLVSISPDMAGKLTFRVARHFDGVYYLNARSEASIIPNKPPTVTRWIQVQNYDGIAAKDRSPGGKLGATVVSPTMAKIYEALVGPCSELPMERVDDPSVNVAASEKGGRT